MEQSKQQWMKLNMEDQTHSFEQSFSRLEKILELMNSGKTSLEDSLKLFEEAEGLIRNCSHKLQFAEQKIEALVKQRGQVVLGQDNKPRVEQFGQIG